jgi:hypothetical protein
MSSNNHHAIFNQDGKTSTPPGSSSRSNKPATKRAREETPSPPPAHAAQLAIEAPQATSPNPDNAPASKRVVFDAVSILSKRLFAVIDELERRVTKLESTPAPTPAAAPCKHEEIIAALQKQLETLTAQVAALAARPAPAPTPAPTLAPAIESQHLAALTKQVTAVSQQLTSLTARHSTTAAAPTKKPAPPAATTANPARAATAKPAPAAATVTPAKPALAAAAENADSTWKPVVSRQTKRRQQAYPPAERRIVVQLAEAPNDTQKAADTALRIVNRALVGHPDVTGPPLYTAYVSRLNALVFTAGPRSRGRDYEPFLGIIRNALAEIPTVSAHVSQRWTRYVLNGIPTATTPEDAREEIEMLYPAAKLAKAPRWLTTAENRQDKAASSMVITLVGPTKLRYSKMLLFNRECDVREYIPLRDTRQCSRCQRFGHPAALCKAAPACAFCAQPHLTHQHPCNIPGCRKGRRCAHPPLCCALCQQPDKATDRSCPAFLALTRSEDAQPCPTPAEDTAMNGQ